MEPVLFSVAVLEVPPLPPVPPMPTETPTAPMLPATEKPPLPPPPPIDCTAMPTELKPDVAILPTLSASAVLAVPPTPPEPPRLTPTPMPPAAAAPEKPPLPPPPPIDCARMPKELAFAVVILLKLETSTEPPAPPVPPVPPSATEIAASGAMLPAIAKPPLPPPPPIDCAMMPVEFSPCVMTAPFVDTLTAPALLPAPPSAAAADRDAEDRVCAEGNREAAVAAAAADRLADDRGRIVAEGLDRVGGRKGRIDVVEPDRDVSAHAAGAARTAEGRANARTARRSIRRHCRRRRRSTAR